MILDENFSSLRLIDQVKKFSEKDISSGGNILYHCKLDMANYDSEDKNFQRVSEGIFKALRVVDREGLRSI